MQHSNVHLIMFGELRLHNAQGADITPRGRKARAMIAWLTRCPGHCAGRDRIVGMLWGDRFEDQARASLRQSLADLKETAPDAAALIRADRTEIGLHPGWTSDLAELEAAIAAGDAPALAALLESMQGELLADLAGLSPGFDDWRMAEQARLEQCLQAEVLPIARQAAESAPRVARAIANGLQRLLEGNEDVVRLGMTLDAAAGDLASVHRRYRTLESVLRREFDVTPSPATKNLLAELAANALAPAHDAQQGPQHGGASPLVILTPFALLAGDAESAALADVLGLDLEAALNRLPDIRVLRHSATGSMPREDILRGAIGGYSLAGSIRPSAGGIRLAIALSDSVSGRILWSHQKDAARDQLGEAIDHVVERVAGALLPSVEQDLIDSRRLEAAAPDAYALYLRARVQLLTTSTLAGAEEAARLLEDALAVDRRFLNPRLQLVLCYNTDFLQRVAGNDERSLRERALRLAQEAMQLEPDNPYAKARLGWCYIRQRAWGQGETLLREALETGGAHADNVQQCGVGLLLCGHVAEGQEWMNRAFRLNPFPRSDYFGDMAIALLVQGEYAQAARQLELAADRSIIYPAMQVASLALAGQPDAAGALLETVRAGVKAIWKGSSGPTDAEVAATIFRFTPMKQGEYSDIIRSGWRKAGLQD